MKAIQYLFLGLLTLVTTSAMAAQDKLKVLMVVSSYGVDGGETRPGYEFDELAQAYLVFRHNDIAVDIASPKGGKVEADKYDKTTKFNADALSDTVFMAKLADTLATKAVNAKDYDGIFVVGGKGAMFDLPKDKALQGLIADIYEGKGSVAAVCHGPAALVDVKLSSGEYLIAGKAVNGFTLEEEARFGKKWASQFDFQLEDRLKERGGKFSSSPMMLSHVALDTRLVTGQNPTSTPKVVDELIRSMGQTPKAREPFLMEHTLDMVAEFWAGKPGALDAFEQSDAGYHSHWVAMYGFLSMQGSEDPEVIGKSVTLLEKAGKYFQHPKLSLAIAQGYQQLGKKAEAKQALESLLKDNPEMAEAKKMLASL